jgi:RNA polymerase sigma-70 factor, ECF subfamily
MRRTIERSAGAAHSRIETVYRECGADVWRSVLVATAGRVEIADEATAEAFARAVRAEATIRDPVAWVYRVALRIAADESRRAGRVAVDECEGATEPWEGVEASDALRAALGRLSMRQRTAVFLYYHGDLAVAEIADRMGTSQPTVRVHLHRGRRRLAHLLREEAAGG